MLNAAEQEIPIAHKTNILKDFVCLQIISGCWHFSIMSMVHLNALFSWAWNKSYGLCAGCYYKTKNQNKPVSWVETFWPFLDS